MNCWICEECGYENEFSDEIKNNECQCCGTPASDKQLIEAQNQLVAYHREQERQALLKEQRKIQELKEKERQARLKERQRKQEQLQRKVYSSIMRIITGMKAVSVIIILLTIFSFLWTEIQFHSKKMPLITWSRNVIYNVSETDIEVLNKVAVPVKTVGIWVFNRGKEQLLTSFENTLNEGKEKIVPFCKNIKQFRKNISSKKLYRSNNFNQTSNYIERKIEIISDRVVTVIKNAFHSFSHRKRNLQLFWSRKIKRNVIMLT